MFNNVGGKIKVLAKVVTWIGAILSVLVGIVMGTQNVIAGVIYGCIGILFSWVSALGLYGYGELVENTNIIAKYAAEKKEY